MAAAGQPGAVDIISSTLAAPVNMKDEETKLDLESNIDKARNVRARQRNLKGMEGGLNTGTDACTCWIRPSWEARRCTWSSGRRSQAASWSGE